MGRYRTNNLKNMVCGQNVYLLIVMSATVLSIFGQINHFLFHDWCMELHVPAYIHATYMQHTCNIYIVPITIGMLCHKLKTSIQISTSH